MNQSRTPSARGGGLPAGLPDAFRFSEVTAHGVSPWTLRRWLAEGLVERVSRGSYQRVDAEPVNPDRLEVALRVPRATICLTSGLVEHDLIDDNPAVLDLALPRGIWRPKLASPVHWHAFAVETFDVDRTVIPIGGGARSATTPARTDSTGVGGIYIDVAQRIPALGLYGPRRCIVDAFRLRHEVGPEIGIEALRRWLRRPASKPGELLSLARDFPASLPALTAALRVLL